MSIDSRVLTRGMYSPQSRSGKNGDPQEFANKFANKVYHALKEKMKRKDHAGKDYICKHDIRSVWNRGDTWEDLTRITRCGPAIMSIIWKHMLQLLSCLVWIGSWDCLIDFHERFFVGLGVPICTDTDIPMTEDGISRFLRNPATNSIFHDKQFIFKPVEIEWKAIQETQVIKHPKTRLPFEVEAKDYLGSGSYGEVKRVIISAWYFRDFFSHRDYQQGFVIEVGPDPNICLYSETDLDRTQQLWHANSLFGARTGKKSERILKF